MSPLAHLVVTDANRMPEADAIYEGMFLLTQQLRDRARLLISMGKSA
ncbi:hypothetical protein [Alcaligenes faecalis]|nr:hypothetical protein [Alcaligenes faecalis]USP49140.1 hypothetical protein J5J84_06495 [Alcaligenes faecalis]